MIFQKAGYTPTLNETERPTVKAAVTYNSYKPCLMLTKSICARALRRCFPKRYIRMRMRRLTLEHQGKLKAVKARDERSEIQHFHDFYVRELDDWLTSIEDTELITKATRMDLSLDDIPLPVDPITGLTTLQHWAETETGNRILLPATRRALHKAVRERGQAYRKERRETYEFYLKIVLGIATAMTGIGGTIIGIISVLKR